jgi:hypothetical protein
MPTVLLGRIPHCNLHNNNEVRMTWIVIVPEKRSFLPAKVHSNHGIQARQAEKKKRLFLFYQCKSIVRTSPLNARIFPPECPETETMLFTHSPVTPCHVCVKETLGSFEFRIAQNEVVIVDSVRFNGAIFLYVRICSVHGDMPERCRGYTLTNPMSAAFSRKH